MSCPWSSSHAPRFNWSVDTKSPLVSIGEGRQDRDEEHESITEYDAETLSGFVDRGAMEDCMHR